MPSATKIKEAELSADNKRELLNTALTDEYKLTPDQTIPRHVYIEDMFEDHVIYRVNDKLFKATYEMAEDGKVTFGDPEEVVAQKTYKPVESLQAKYSEIIQETGRRNVDSDKVKETISLCQELLDSQEPTEAKIKKEAHAVDMYVKNSIDHDEMRRVLGKEPLRS